MGKEILDTYIQDPIEAEEEAYKEDAKRTKLLKEREEWENMFFSERMEFLEKKIEEIKREKAEKERIEDEEIKKRFG